MAASWQCEGLDEDDQSLHLTCAKIRKESALLREDAREYRDHAERVRVQGATLRERAAALFDRSHSSLQYLLCDHTSLAA